MNTNKTESALYNRLKRLLGGDWARIESVVGSGVPDVNYCFTVPGVGVVEGWTELKVLHKKYDPDAPLKLHNFRAAQFAWLCRRAKAGGRVSISVGTMEGGVIIIPPELFMKVRSGEAPMSDYPYPITLSKKYRTLLYLGYMDQESPEPGERAPKPQRIGRRKF